MGTNPVRFKHCTYLLMFFFKEKSFTLLVRSGIFLNIRDDVWLVFLSINISETRHVVKNVTTDITVSSKLLIDETKICISLRYAVLKKGRNTREVLYGSLQQ